MNPPIPRARKIQNKHCAGRQMKHTNDRGQIFLQMQGEEKHNMRRGSGFKQEGEEEEEEILQSFINIIKLILDFLIGCTGPVQLLQPTSQIHSSYMYI